MPPLNYKTVKEAVEKLGHKWFSGGEFNLNIVGIRCKDTDSNKFNDLFIVAFSTHDNESIFVFSCTTDPGTFYRENPLNVEGTAIVKPGQYFGVWEIGKHQGKYQALVQRGEITVFRDNDKNASIDIGEGTKTETGLFGINCHQAAMLSSKVGKWSAGCQVLNDAYDFKILMALCSRAASIWGNKFSYTLIEEGDL